MFSVLIGVLLLVVILYLLPTVEIDGTSMYPTYRDGQKVLGTRVFNKAQPKLGSVYVYTRLNEDCEQYLVVKRLTKLKICEQGLVLCYFEGDNKDDSFDSRHYGWVSANNIIAKVIEKR